MSFQQDSEGLNFDDLPISIQLEIFSYLDIHSILNAESVSSSWKSLSSDEVLWKKRLNTDMKKWNIIGSNFNPLVLQHLAPKDIYYKCSPITRRLQNESLIDKFTKALRSIVVGKVPKLVMCGPGLEAGNVRLVRRLLQDPTKTFQCIDMHSSQFGGVGSGVVLRLLNHHLDFVLITLYTATKQLRESRSVMERNAANIFVPYPQQNSSPNNYQNGQNGLSNGQSSNISNSQSNASSNERQNGSDPSSNSSLQNSLRSFDNSQNHPPNNHHSSVRSSNNHHPIPPSFNHHIPPSFNHPIPPPSFNHHPISPPSRNHLKLQKNIHDLMKTQDGLIYVLDASSSMQDLESGVPELLALSQQLLPPSPVLILLSSQLKQHNLLTCIDVVRVMTLSKLTRPWQVHHCIVEGMLGVEKAFHWIVEASRR